MTNKLKRIAAHFIACSLRKTTERCAETGGQVGAIGPSGRERYWKSPRRVKARANSGEPSPRAMRMHIQREKASLPKAALVARSTASDGWGHLSHAEFRHQPWWIY